MTDVSYICVSLMWALYGLVAGFGIGMTARVLWAEIKRK